MAVDGTVTEPCDWADVDTVSFRRKHGRTILPGEYGCYRSHLKALETAAEMEAPYAVVIEDDVALAPDMPARLEAIIDAVPDLDLVKLLNHRVKGFVAKAKTPQGDEIGRAMHGPLGSGAAYLVSRTGAAKLRKALAVMELPWDIALERHWVTGIHFYTVRRNMVRFSKHRGRSTISPGPSYAKTKLPAWQRIPTAVFRLQDYGWRCIGALR